MTEKGMRVTEEQIQYITVKQNYDDGISICEGKPAMRR